MIEVGIVTECKGNRATVKVDKKEECSKCGMCLFPKNASSIEITAQNDLGARVGDTVIIESKKDYKLLGAILVFLIPLLLIGLSALITYLFIGNEIWLVILSVISIILWYTILAVIDKRLKKLSGGVHIIVSILKKGEIIDE